MVATVYFRPKYRISRSPPIFCSLLTNRSFFDGVDEISVTSNSNLFQGFSYFDSHFSTNVHESWAPFLFKIISCAAATIKLTIISINIDSDPFQFLLRSSEKLFRFPLTVSNLKNRCIKIVNCYKTFLVTTIRATELLQLTLISRLLPS